MVFQISSQLLIRTLHCKELQNSFLRTKPWQPGQSSYCLMALFSLSGLRLCLKRPRIDVWVMSLSSTCQNDLNDNRIQTYPKPPLLCLGMMMWEPSPESPIRESIFSKSWNHESQTWTFTALHMIGNKGWTDTSWKGLQVQIHNSFFFEGKPGL